MSSSKRLPVLRSIVLAEFDIDKGSLVRVQYPLQLENETTVTNPEASSGPCLATENETLSYMAEQMLPDGTEKQTNMVTLFMLNRPTENEHNGQSVLARIPVETFRLKPGGGNDQHQGGGGGEGGAHQCNWKKLTPECGSERLIIQQHEPEVGEDSLLENASAAAVPGPNNDGCKLHVSCKGEDLFVIDPNTWDCELLPDGVPEDIIQHFSTLVASLESAATVGASVTPSASRGVGAISPAAEDRGKPPYFLFLKAPNICGSGGSSKGGVPDVFGMVLMDVHHVTSILKWFRSNSEFLTAGPSAASEDLTGGGGGGDQSKGESVNTSTDKKAPSPPPSTSTVSKKKSSSSKEAKRDSPSPIYCLNTVWTKKDMSVRRGGINKAICLTGYNLTYLVALQPHLAPILLEYCCSVKGNDEVSIKKQRDAISSVYHAVENCFLVHPDQAAAVLPTSSLRAVHAHCLQQSDAVNKVYSCPLSTCSFLGTSSKTVHFRVPLRQPVSEIMFTGGYAANPASASITGGGGGNTAASPVTNFSMGSSNSDQTPGFGSMSPASPTTVTAPTLLSISVANLIRVHREDFFVVLTAMLMSKRVLVFSKNLSATEVNHCVFGFGLVMTSVFPTFLQRRVFPYTSVGFMDKFLSVPGYIVGTLNPLLENHKEWYDVSLDLDTAYSTVGVHGSASSQHSRCAKIHKESVKSVVEHSNHTQYDAPFLKELLIFIEQSIVKRICDEEIEMTVRHKVKEYLQIMLRCGLTNEHWNEPFQKEVLERNMLRIMAVHSTSLFDDWRSGRHHATMMNSPTNAVTTASTNLNTTTSSRYEGGGSNSSSSNNNGGGGSDTSLASLVSHLSLIAISLRHLKNPDDITLMQLLQHILRQVHTQDQVVELLAQFPCTLGGLAPICSLIFHPSKAVQLVAMAVLRLFDRYPISKPSITNMNSFLMLAYEQCNSLIPDTSSAFGATK